MKAGDVHTPEDWDAYVGEHGYPPSWPPQHRKGSDVVPSGPGGTGAIRRGGRVHPPGPHA